MNLKKLVSQKKLAHIISQKKLAHIIMVINYPLHQKEGDF